MKKATRYFLPRADFGKGSIAFGIEINLERFLIRSDIHLGFHNFQDVGIYGLLNRRVWGELWSDRHPEPRRRRRISRLFVQPQTNCEIPRIHSG
jgi:hypothetical protein